MSNPLLERARIPGETVRLPSLGLFYTNGELSPDVKNGEVHVYPMSAYDEIIMHSVDRLINGTAFDEVFSRCIPSILKPLELFSKDIDFLMICLKRVTYGPMITVNYQHTCDDAKYHSYEVDVSPFINTSKVIDPTTVNTTYQTILENGQVVHIHPIKMKDVISLMQEAQQNTGTQEKVLDSLATVIASVDEVTDKNHILEWLHTIPVKMHKQISASVDSSSDWGPSTIVEGKCKDCGADIKIDVPLNPVIFFT